MREIIFRGKRVDNGEWVYGDLIHERYGTCIQFIITVNPRGEGAPERKPTIERHKATIDPATVGQYTGLKDKNGKDIYEGDIVRVNYTVRYSAPDKEDEEHISIAPVYWNNFRSSFALEFSKFANDDLFRFVRDKYAEVIGNIYENPELLESGVKA